MVIIATFATSLRAASLVDELKLANIAAVAVRPKWINKRLPPPRIEVKVSEEDLSEALAIKKAFLAETE